MQYSESRDELDEIIGKQSQESRKVFYDFDNTLFLDNSTNLYFNTIRPRWLVCIIFYLLNFIFDKFKIDRFVWEDYVKTIIGIYLFPLSYFRWRYRTAKFFAKKLTNDELLRSDFKNGRKFIVISFGHREIIEPILRNMDIDYELISSSVLFKMKNIRKKGKLHYIEKYLEPGDKEACLFVTDSKDDDELLDYFDQSFLLVWRKQTPVSFHNVYLPFKYTAKCKYVVKNILWNQHIGEDFVVLLLAFGLFMPLDILAISFLFLSFFIIYEIGYYENDFKASKKEDNPSLSGNQKEYLNYPIYRYGSLWALSTSAIGIYYVGDDFLFDYFSWLFTLSCLFILFRVFNNINPNNRVYLFPILQLFKTFSYTMFFKINPVGAILLFSQVMRQTTNYNIYRTGGRVQAFKRQNHRLLMFIMLIVTLVITGVISIVNMLNIQFFVICLWLLQRSITRDMGGYRNFCNKIITIPRVVFNKVQGK